MLYIAILHLIIASYILINRGMLDFKVPFCRELPSPLPVELPTARLGGGGGGLLRVMGHRREPRVVRCVGIDLLSHPSWC